MISLNSVDKVAKMISGKLISLERQIRERHGSITSNQRVRVIERAKKEGGGGGLMKDHIKAERSED